jgi:large subunit ribosomal protein L25
VKEAVQHVDFLELVDNKPVVIGIPVKLVGRSKGVLNGGRLQQVFRRLKVQALPKDLPSEIEIDITPIKIGQSRRVSDVVLPGVTMLDPQNAVVVSVKRARGAVLTDEEESEAAAEAASDAAEENA